MRIAFDKNVPVGVRRFLTPKHEVWTFNQLKWDPRLGDDQILEAAEAAGFNVLVTADQNIKYQQNLSRRRISLVVLGSNIWPIVQQHGADIVVCIDSSSPGSWDFVGMGLPQKPRKR